MKLSVLFLTLALAQSDYDAAVNKAAEKEANKAAKVAEKAAAKEAAIAAKEEAQLAQGSKSRQKSCKIF